jgi:hypothetical protein
MPFSRLGPLDSSFSTDMAVGELVDADGKSGAEEQTWGMAGNEVLKKGGTSAAADIYMTR